MKLTKRNKVRIVIAMTLSGIFFIIAYMPALAAILLILAWLWGMIELVRFLLEEVFGFDFDDE